MALGPWLGVALALAVPGEQAVAPLGPSHAAEGSRLDLVLRGPEGLHAGEPAMLKLLLSDAATDAPVPGASVSLSLFGPKGVAPIRGEAVAGGGPGAYLLSTRFLAAGRYAAVAALSKAAAGELLAADGLEVAAEPLPPIRRSPLWPFILGIGAGLLLWAALRKRIRPVAAAGLLLLAAGDARAHGAYTPPPASVPGAKVFLAQEIQFALAIRTVPAAVEAFAAPEGNAAASRQFVGVPRSAVVERDGHKLIFVRVAPERFVAREPKLGWEDVVAGVPRVAVLSGLELDEKVVVQGAAFLRNGGGEAR